MTAALQKGSAVKVRLMDPIYCAFSVTHIPSADGAMHLRNIAWEMAFVYLTSFPFFVKL
jgi:hypothetical protein